MTEPVQNTTPDEDEELIWPHSLRRHAKPGDKVEGVTQSTLAVSLSMAEVQWLGACVALERATRERDIAGANRAAGLAHMVEINRPRTIGDLRARILAAQDNLWKSDDD